MIAAFYNFTVFQHHNGIRIAYGGETMCDDKRGSSLH